MRAHIVPETYLSSWKNNIGNNSIFVFDSTNYSCDNKNLNVLNNTYFQEKDEYILKLGDCTEGIYQDLFDNIYKVLSKKYIIKYKKNIVNSGYRLRNCCRALDNKNDWEITNIEDGQRYKFNKFKDELENEWNNNYNDEIERFFCDNYENYWNSFTNYIFQSIKLGKGLVDLGEYDEYFFEFVSLLLTRQYSNFEEYKKIIFSLIDKFKITDNFIESNIKKIWLSQFFKFKLFKEQSLNSCKSNLISLTVNYLKSKEISLEFLISKSISFFTSDNPIFRIEDGKDSSIYFPVTKEICLKIIPQKRKSENLYYYYEINQETTKKINDYIIKNSKKNFICIKNDFKNYCNVK